MGGRGWGRANGASPPLQRQPLSRLDWGASLLLATGRGLVSRLAPAGQGWPCFARTGAGRPFPGGRRGLGPRRTEGSWRKRSPRRVARPRKGLRVGRVFGAGILRGGVGLRGGCAKDLPWVTNHRGRTSDVFTWATESTLSPCGRRAVSGTGCKVRAWGIWGVEV